MTEWWNCLSDPAKIVMVMLGAASGATIIVSVLSVCGRAVENFRDKTFGGWLDWIGIAIVGAGTVLLLWGIGESIYCLWGLL